MAEAVHALGEVPRRVFLTVGRLELAPFAEELRARLREVEDEYKRLQGADAEWTPQRLQSLLRTQLRGDKVIVVSYAEYEEAEVERHQPVVVHVGASNEIVTADSDPRRLATVPAPSPAVAELRS